MKKWLSTTFVLLLRGCRQWWFEQSALGCLQSGRQAGIRRHARLHLSRRRNPRLHYKHRKERSLGIQDFSRSHDRVLDCRRREDFVSENWPPKKMTAQRRVAACRPYGIQFGIEP